MNALIVTDVQNDFTPATDQKPDGALAVPDGNAVVPIINQLMPAFDIVSATQDWHPPDHCSFASQHPGHEPGDVIEWHGLEQVLWPDHCVQYTQGAALLADLDLSRLTHVVHKGHNRDIDSYSTFYDNGHVQSTGLGEYLEREGVTDVYLVGLATDYCVKCSALDAVKLGFRTHVILDACRGVNLQPTDVDQAVQQMKQAGVRILHSDAAPTAAPDRR